MAVGTHLSEAIPVDKSYIKVTHGGVPFHRSLSKGVVIHCSRKSRSILRLFPQLLRDPLLDFAKRYFAKFACRIFGNFTMTDAAAFRLKANYDFFTIECTETYECSCTYIRSAHNTFSSGYIYNRSTDLLLIAKLHRKIIYKYCWFKLDEIWPNSIEDIILMMRER